MDRFWAVMVALLCLALPAEADAEAGRCVLTPLAALPLVKSVPNLPIAPAHIDDQWTWLIIDTGAIRSLMFSHAADALKLARSDLRSNLDSVNSLAATATPVLRGRGRGALSGSPVIAPPSIDTSKIVLLNQLQTSPFSIYGAGGQPIRQQTTGQPVRLGKLEFPDVSFLVIPDGVGADSPVAGMFGMDVLRGYDLELNLAQHWVNLFSQDHCDGKVVYWGADYLKAPITVSESGQIFVDVVLDGQHLSAMIDTGASYSSIRQGDASWLFGLHSDSPGAEAVDSTTAADGSVLTTYRAPFKTLEVAGVTFGSPEIHILPNIKDGNLPDRAAVGAHSDAPVMTLGVKELSRLRLFLALREHELYVTPATPDQPT